MDEVGLGTLFQIIDFVALYLLSKIALDIVVLAGGVRNTELMPGPSIALCRSQFDLTASVWYNFCTSIVMLLASMAIFAAFKPKKRPIFDKIVVEKSVDMASLNSLPYSMC